MLAESRPVMLRSASMQIRRSFPDVIQHPRVREVYSAFDKETEQQIKSRADQVQLAQIRSGKHNVFQAYMHKHGKADTPECPLCQGEDHTLEHWFLRCPETLEARMDIFGGEDEYGLHQLTKKPSKAMAERDVECGRDAERKTERERFVQRGRERGIEKKRK